MGVTAKELASSIKHIHQLGGQALAAAKDNDWEQVERLDQQRQQLIKQTLSDELFTQLPETILLKLRPELEKIKALGIELLALAKQQQQQTGNEIKSFNQSRKASKAYKG